jgi:hypothetical protein
LRNGAVFPSYAGRGAALPKNPLVLSDCGV